MVNDRAGHLLDQIGQILAEDTEFPLDGTLLYAEVGEDFVSPSIFKDRGDHVLYRSPDLDRLGDALQDLWEAQDADRRWVEIEYIVRDNKFRAIFVYPEDVDSEENSVDRRRNIVTKHFGPKRIAYPSPRRGAVRLKG